jgi:hypothetical protein
MIQAAALVAPPAADTAECTPTADSSSATVAEPASRLEGESNDADAAAAAAAETTAAKMMTAAGGAGSGAVSSVSSSGTSPATMHTISSSDSLVDARSEGGCVRAVSALSGYPQCQVVLIPYSDTGLGLEEVCLRVHEV